MPKHENLISGIAQSWQTSSKRPRTNQDLCQQNRQRREQIRSSATSPLPACVKSCFEQKRCIAGIQVRKSIVNNHIPSTKAVKGLCTMHSLIDVTLFAELLLHSFKRSLPLALLAIFSVTVSLPNSDSSGAPGICDISETEIKQEKTPWERPFHLPKPLAIRWGTLSGIFTFDLNFTWSHGTAQALKDCQGKRDSSGCATLCMSNNVNSERLLVRASLRRLARERKIGCRRRLHNSFEFAKGIWFGNSEQQRCCSLNLGLVSTSGKCQFWKNKNTLIHCKSVKTFHKWELATSRVIPLYLLLGGV